MSNDALKISASRASSRFRPSLLLINVSAYAKRRQSSVSKFKTNSFSRQEFFRARRLGFRSSPNPRSIRRSKTEPCRDSQSLDDRHLKMFQISLGNRLIDVEFTHGRPQPF